MTNTVGFLLLNNATRRHQGLFSSPQSHLLLFILVHEKNNLDMKTDPRNQSWCVQSVEDTNGNLHGGVYVLSEGSFSEVIDETKMSVESCYI